MNPSAQFLDDFPLGWEHRENDPTTSGMSIHAAECRRINEYAWHRRELPHSTTDVVPHPHSSSNSVRHPAAWGGPSLVGRDLPDSAHSLQRVGRNQGNVFSMDADQLKDRSIDELKEIVNQLANLVNAKLLQEGGDGRTSTAPDPATERVVQELELAYTAEKERADELTLLSKSYLRRIDQLVADQAMYQQQKGSEETIRRLKEELEKEQARTSTLEQQLTEETKKCESWMKQATSSAVVRTESITSNGTSKKAASSPSLLGCASARVVSKKIPVRGAFSFPGRRSRTITLGSRTVRTNKEEGADALATDDEDHDSSRPRVLWESDCSGSVPHTPRAQVLRHMQAIPSSTTRSSWEQQTDARSRQQQSEHLQAETLRPKACAVATSQAVGGRDSFIGISGKQRGLDYTNTSTSSMRSYGSAPRSPLLGEPINVTRWLAPLNELNRSLERVRGELHAAHAQMHQLEAQVAAKTQQLIMKDRKEAVLQQRYREACDALEAEQREHALTKQHLKEVTVLRDQYQACLTNRANERKLLDLT